MTMIWTNAEQLQAERDRVKKVVAQLRNEIAELHDRLGCRQESLTDITFDRVRNTHLVQFCFSDYLVDADPCISALATTIAERIKAYIRERKKPGLTEDRAQGVEHVPDLPATNGLPPAP